jgi:nicotinamidase-related amidase
MLRLDDTVFVLIDVQEKLFNVMDQRDVLLTSCTRAVTCMQRLGVPVILTEQIPEKMGSTVPSLRDSLGDLAPICKSSFSCCGEDAFVSAITAAGRKRVLIAGIETHVCVYQTAADLYEAGYHVEVLADAVSSRTPLNRDIGLQRIQSAGGQLTSVETAVFELMRTAEHDAFRDVLRVIK